MDLWQLPVDAVQATKYASFRCCSVGVECVMRQDSDCASCGRGRGDGRLVAAAPTSLAVEDDGGVVGGEGGGVGTVGWSATK